MTRSVLLVAGSGRKARGRQRAAAPKALKEDSDDASDVELDLEGKSSDVEPAEPAEPLTDSEAGKETKRPRRKQAAAGKRKDGDFSKGKSTTASRRKPGKSGLGNAKPAVLAPARQALPPQEEYALCLYCD